jgi:hypothetical protein
MAGLIRGLVMLGLVACLALIGGCSAVPIPGAYTLEMAAAECRRTGGWWHYNVAGGYCEYQSPGFL